MFLFHCGVNAGLLREKGKGNVSGVRLRYLGVKIVLAYEVYLPRDERISAYRRDSSLGTYSWIRRLVLDLCFYGAPGT